VHDAEFGGGKNQCTVIASDNLVAKSLMSGAGEDDEGKARSETF